MSRNLRLFRKLSRSHSARITNSYSTSFSLGIRLFHPTLRAPIRSLYAFVRVADEIVDTFQDYPKEKMLEEFMEDTHKAIDRGISTNMVLNSFQEVVNRHKIDREFIDAFFQSMRMDLKSKDHTRREYENYIYGSAEVVGLMCLRIFCENDRDKYDELKESAKALSSAFQKINFLRDAGEDYYELGRTYFPEVTMTAFNDVNKKKIEEDIREDLKVARKGIRKLPAKARDGVYLAYLLYCSLFEKIRLTPAEKILTRRVRISTRQKLLILVSAPISYHLGY